MTTRSGASLADVAKLAGVSAQTVSRVANGSDAVRQKTRERVLAAMDELGYRPSFAARSLRAGRYRSVGLAMSGNLSATGRRNQFEGVTTAASNHDYAVTLLHLADSSDYGEASRRMATLPVDGAILSLSVTPDDFDDFEASPGLPVVIIGDREQPHCPTVGSDQVACSRAIVEHLVSHGHREIRFVAGPRESLSNRGRLEGWRRGMERHGLRTVEPLVGDWTADSGYELGAQLARDGACTAVYASNDAMAVGVILALRDRGVRVPEDVSVVGVDDSYRGMLPRLDLTTYRFDDARVGAVAFDLATRPPAAGGEQPHVLVSGALVERGSVADLT